jgi:hypothetical protein
MGRKPSSIQSELTRHGILLRWVQSRPAVTLSVFRAHRFLEPSLVNFPTRATHCLPVDVADGPMSLRSTLNAGTFGSRPSLRCWKPCSQSKLVSGSTGAEVASSSSRWGCRTPSSQLVFATEIAGRGSPDERHPNGSSVPERQSKTLFTFTSGSIPGVWCPMHPVSSNRPRRDGPTSPIGATFCDGEGPFPRELLDCHSIDALLATVT